MFAPHIFRANDIRGHWQKDFDLSFTKNLADALCKIAKNKDILKPYFLIGHDSRLSSPKLSQTLSKHLKNQGACVAEIGLAPSPLCYFLLQHYNLTACIVVTASHNPLEDNGFKILFHKKYKLFKGIQKLKKLILKKQTPKKKFKQKGFNLYLEKEKPYLLSLQKEFSSLKKIPFVLDTGNGALGPLAEKVYSSFELKPKYLFKEPNGLFPNHHPDPTVEQNLFFLKKKVKETKSLFGFGFDGDGDRLVIITKNGKKILGDELGFLFLNSLLQINKQDHLILGDVKCSDWFFRSAKKAGFKSLITKSGHGLIREKMEQKKALLAIEFSGHIFFNDRKERGFDDALYASLRFLEIVSQSKQNFETLLPQFKSEKSPEIRLPLIESKIEKILSKIHIYLKKKEEVFKNIDGIRVSRKTSWALFRSSKTQSVLSMRFEAKDKRDLKNLKNEFSEVIGLKIP